MQFLIKLCSIHIISVFTFVRIIADIQGIMGDDTCNQNEHS